MMKYKYSPSTNLFYVVGLHTNIPPDARDVDHDLYKEIMNGSGRWHPDETGMPKQLLPLDSHEELHKSPRFVTRAQGKAALILAGLWPGVVDFVNSIEDAAEKSVAEVALHDTTQWQRSSPFLNSAAQALGLTDEQLDQLFIDASKIEL